MTQTQRSIDSPRVVVAAAATGTAAVVVFALLPVLSGSLADHYDLSDLDTGLVATTYFLVYALIALTSGFWIRRWNWKMASMVGLALMILGLATGMVVASFQLTLVCLAVIGFGAGLLFPISLALVSDTQKTERNYAFKLSAEQLVPAAVLFLLSSTLFVGFDLGTLLGGMLVVVVICMLLSVGMPAGGVGAARPAAKDHGSFALALLALVALGTNFAGFAGIWAFLERIAVESDLDSDFAATWIAVGLITSGVGPLATAALGRRLGNSWPLIVSTAMALLSLLFLTDRVTTFSYAAVLTILPLTYYFSIAYLLSAVAAADYNGRFSGVMSFSLAMGAAGGAALFGALKAADLPVIFVMGCLIAGGAMGSLWVQHRLGVNQSEVIK